MSIHSSLEITLSSVFTSSDRTRKAIKSDLGDKKDQHTHTQKHTSYDTRSGAEFICTNELRRGVFHVGISVLVESDQEEKEGKNSERGRH
jgi:hypothetical protein